MAISNAQSHDSQGNKSDLKAPLRDLNETKDSASSKIHDFTDKIQEKIQEKIQDKLPEMPSSMEMKEIVSRAGSWINENRSTVALCAAFGLIGFFFGRIGNRSESLSNVGEKIVDGAKDLVSRAKSA